MGENFNKINDSVTQSFVVKQSVKRKSDAFFPLAFSVHLLIKAINKIFVAVIGRRQDLCGRNQWMVLSVLKYLGQRGFIGQIRICPPK